MTGQGAAFDDLDGSDSSQLTVVQAEDGYVYITVVAEGRKAIRFVATDAQAQDIATAIRKAVQR